MTADRSTVRRDVAPLPRAALWLIGARIANVTLAIAVIPVLLYALGVTAFAAWALLLAASAVFALLEVGVVPTFVKFAAPVLDERKAEHSARTLGALLANALAIIVVAYATFAGVVAILSALLFGRALEPWFTGIISHVSHLLGLPQFSGEIEIGTLLAFVFFASGVRSVLQFGGLLLNASQRFSAVSKLSFVQALFSNVAACTVALSSERLDATVVAYWSAQLAVSAVAFVSVRNSLSIRLKLCRPSFQGARILLSHGLRVQVFDWAQVASYQFDKFLLASGPGLAAVASYEVANRCALALRSLPASGTEALLSYASVLRDNSEMLWRRYQLMTRLAWAGAFVFLLLPAAVAPLLLFAWTGGIGFDARWIALPLLLGSAAGVLALPAASVVQALGKPELHARAALCGLAVNVPLSLLLVTPYGGVGVACGSAVALSIAAGMLIHNTHRLLEKSIADSLRDTFRGGAVLWFSWLLIAGAAWGFAALGMGFVNSLSRSLGRLEALAVCGLLAAFGLAAAYRAFAHDLTRSLRGGSD